MNAINDLPYRTAVARDTLVARLQDVFEVDARQAELLALTIFTVLVQRQLDGGPPVTVQGEAYHVGTEPLMPHVLALAPEKDRYLALFPTAPREAHDLIQRALRQRLGPSRPA